MTAARLIALLICAGSVQANAAVGGDCTWRDPGREPYTGSTHRAIMSFDRIDRWDRLALIGRVWLGLRNDVVAIGQAGITGRASVAYGPAVRDMHFGRSRVCSNVTRDGWPASHVELADSYRVGNTCVLKPRVCGNLAWATCDDAQQPTPAPDDKRVHQVAEPSTLWLAFAALAALFGISRRVKR